VNLTVGPDSVGHKLQTLALAFGGSTPTATDYTIVADSLSSVGDPSLPALRSISAESVQEYCALVRQKLEDIIDSIKTSPEDLPVLLVGGGAIIAPNSLAGASSVIKPDFGQVANAIGAAIARVSGTVDAVYNTTNTGSAKTTQQIVQEASEVAIQRAIENGASMETVCIMEMDVIPVPYIAGKVRVIGKAVGEFDFSRRVIYDMLLNEVPPFQEDSSTSVPFPNTPLKIPDAVEASLSSENPAAPLSVTSILSYTPRISGTTAGSKWHVSITDLEWISTGCYILGCGGGGNPYASFLRIREMIRNGEDICIMRIEDLEDGDVVASGGLKGSPTVSVEKLAANE
jgi:hypothetical protein